MHLLDPSSLLLSSPSGTASPRSWTRLWTLRLHVRTTTRAHLPSAISNGSILRPRATTHLVLAVAAVVLAAVETWALFLRLLRLALRLRNTNLCRRSPPIRCHPPLRLLLVLLFLQRILRQPPLHPRDGPTQCSRATTKRCMMPR